MLLHLNTHFHQFGGDTVHVFGNDILDEDLSAGGGHSGHVCAGLDLIGNNGVTATLQVVHAADFDGVCASAPDIGPHRIEEVGQVHNVGFLGSVFDNGGPLRTDGGHHDVHGGTNGHHIQVDVGALQSASFGGSVDETAFDHHLGARAVKPLTCWSMGRTPKLQPPGMATSAWPTGPAGTR